MDTTIRWPRYVLMDGGEVQPLDLFLVDIDREAPQIHQPENWEMGPRRWQLIERPAAGEALRSVQRLLKVEGSLFGGPSDRISFEQLQANPARESLAIVRPSGLELLAEYDRFRQRRRLRAVFEFSGARYNLSVTDPWWEDALRRLPPGRYTASNLPMLRTRGLTLTVSLGEPFDGFCYKFVAAIFSLPEEQV